MDGLLTLSDGRTMSYGRFGDPEATSVFDCHGFPTNRIEYEGIAHVVEKSGVAASVVVLDRPGYGSSTFQSGRTLLDWPKDVAETADRLGIDEFAVVGASGGGPYAMACAAAMPDRVTRLGLVVAAGPADAPGMDESLILRTVPRSSLMRRVQFGLMGVGLRRGRDDQILEQTLANLGEADRPFLQRPDNREWFLRMIREALKQGGRAAAHDARLYLDSWGFEPAGIASETRLWYGARDETVPAAVGGWLAGQLANAHLVIWPQHGHFTWMTSMEAAEVVATAVGIRTG